MKYTNIHCARITRTILDRLMSMDRELPDYGEISKKSLEMCVMEYLEGDVLADVLADQYNEVTGRFGCPFSVEEALILGIGGFNAEPMEQFASGEVTLERAVETCFEQTFYDAMTDTFGEPASETKNTEVRN
jgi:hypothetical protein